MFVAGESVIETLLNVADQLDWAYRQNFSSDDTKVELTMEVPGKKPTDISLEIEENILKVTIKGQGTRRYRLADSIDQEAVTARTEYGVLTVTLPKKAPPKAAVRKIEVK